MKNREMEKKIEVPAADYLCAHILCFFFLLFFSFGFNATKWFVHMSVYAHGFRHAETTLFSCAHFNGSPEWTKAIFSLFFFVFLDSVKLGKKRIFFFQTKFICTEKRERVQEIPF